MKTDYAGHDRAYQRRKAKGQAGWDTAAGYETFQALAERLLQRPGLPGSGNLLELGCGAGDMSLWLAEKGYRVSGVDIAPTAIEWAREKARQRVLNVDFQVGDVLHLPEEFDADFDIVFDGHCFHCIIGKDRSTFLKNALRVLKPGGHLLIASMCGEVINQEWLPRFDLPSRCLISSGIASRYIGLPESIVKEVAEAGFLVSWWDVQANDAPNDVDDLLIVAQKP